MNPVSNDIDANLVIALNAGDRKAFEAIYRKYVSELFAYARRNISNKEDCEEIIQDVFESLWLKHNTLHIQVSLRAYLMGMVRYKIIHCFQKNGLKRKYAEHFLLFEAVYEQIEDEEINHSAIQSTLDKLITELPERCQTGFITGERKMSMDQ